MRTDLFMNYHPEMFKYKEIQITTINLILNFLYFADS